jgi:hypothetical protein
MANITSINSFLAFTLLLAVLGLSSPVQAEEQGLQARTDLRLQKRGVLVGKVWTPPKPAQLKKRHLIRVTGLGARIPTQPNPACPVKLMKRQITAALGAKALRIQPGC